MSNKSAFRSDINGLRAWAVMAVVLYHFGFQGVAGGFQGVDVFFVISGFLMTGLVVSGLEKSGRDYSVAGFYLARARRIVPALVVLCLSLLLMGWWFLPAPDYRKLADHASLSMLFLSNLKYLGESGYFDTLSHDKWLLHTWSLSVEWQFYLLFPVLMKWLWRWKADVRVLRGVVVALLLASLVACVVVTSLNASQAFYLLPTRAWEMLAGGLVFFAQRHTASLLNSVNQDKQLARGLYWTGFGLIFAGMLLFSGNDPWPGWRAVLPAVGASLVLLARRDKGLLTQHSLFQWLGDRSYSIYLWHWPLVVVANYLEVISNAWAMTGGVLASLILGALSYRWVETPSRKSLGAMSRKKASWWTLAWIVIPLCLTSAVLIKKGITGRVSPLSEQALQEQNNSNPRDKECHVSMGVTSPGCIYGGPNIKAIVIGDSHANAIVNAVAEARAHADDGVLEWSYSACPVLMNAKMIPGRLEAHHQCHDFISGVIRDLDQKYEGVPVVLISRWAQYALGRNEKLSETNIPYVYFGDKVYSTATPEFLTAYANDMVSTVCHLAAKRKVFLLRPVPEMGVEVPAKLARVAIWGGEMDVRLSMADYMKRQKWIWEAQDRAHKECGAEILDSTSILCRDGSCHGAREGRSLYYDDDHLSEYGNRLLVPLFRRVFTQN